MEIEEVLGDLFEFFGRENKTKQLARWANKLASKDIDVKRLAEVVARLEDTESTLPPFSMIYSMTVEGRSTYRDIPKDGETEEEMYARLENEAYKKIYGKYPQMGTFAVGKEGF